MASDIKNQLIEWAEKTNNIYHQLASGKDGNHLSYYTQSVLNNIGEEPVEVMVVGINPGSEGNYEEMLANKHWTGSDDIIEKMPSSHLLEGNHFFNEKLNCTSWDMHLSWKYFQNLMGYFSMVDGYNKNILLDEKRFVLTNLTFFNTKNVQSLPKDIQKKTFGCTIELINIIKPKMVVFLGVEEGRKLLGTIEEFKENTAAMKVFDGNPKIGSGVYVGNVSNIPCVTLRHPAYSTNEENVFVKTFLRYTFAQNIQDGERWNEIYRKCIDAVKFIITTKKLFATFNKLYPSENIMRWVYAQDILVTEILLAKDKKGNIMRKIANVGNIAMDLIPVKNEHTEYNECKYRLVIFYRHNNPSIRQEQTKHIAEYLGMEFNPWIGNNERHVLRDFMVCSDADINSMADVIYGITSKLLDINL